VPPNATHEMSVMHGTTLNGANPVREGVTQRVYTTWQMVRIYNKPLFAWMVIVGAGVIALNIVSNFCNVWFQWIQCSERLFQSKWGDKWGSKITTKQVNTLRPRGDSQDDFPLLKFIFGNNEGGSEIECECILVGLANVENWGLDEAGVNHVASSNWCRAVCK
jgi:hypothetical protein